MAVDYRKQYTARQLEPFWPNEILRMSVVVLCTLALIMALAVLPVALDTVGLGELLHHEEPANPRSTPEHIRPEWYFLPVYQYLKLPPQELLGVSGKTIGVLSQLPMMLAIVLLPFWARRWSGSRPGTAHRAAITLVIAGSIGLTIWAAWPPRVLFLMFLTAAVVVFYVLIWSELRTVRRVLYEPEERD